MAARPALQAAWAEAVQKVPAGGDDPPRVRRCALAWDACLDGRARWPASTAAATGTGSTTRATTSRRPRCDSPKGAVCAPRYEARPSEVQGRGPRGARACEWSRSAFTGRPARSGGRNTSCRRLSRRDDGAHELVISSAPGRRRPASHRRGLVGGAVPLLHCAKFTRSGVGAAPHRRRAPRAPQVRRRAPTVTVEVPSRPSPSPASGARAVDGCPAWTTAWRAVVVRRRGSATVPERRGARPRRALGSADACEVDRAALPERAAVVHLRARDRHATAPRRCSRGLWWWRAAARWWPWPRRVRGAGASPSELGFGVDDGLRARRHVEESARSPR